MLYKGLLLNDAKDFVELDNYLQETLNSESPSNDNKPKTVTQLYHLLATALTVLDDSGQWSLGYDHAGANGLQERFTSIKDDLKQNLSEVRERYGDPLYTRKIEDHLRFVEQAYNFITSYTTKERTHIHIINQTMSFVDFWINDARFDLTLDKAIKEIEDSFNKFARQQQKEKSKQALSLKDSHNVNAQPTTYETISGYDEIEPITGYNATKETLKHFKKIRIQYAQGKTILNIFKDRRNELELSLELNEGTDFKRVEELTKQLSSDINFFLLNTESLAKLAQANLEKTPLRIMYNLEESLRDHKKFMRKVLKMK